MLMEKCKPSETNAHDSFDFEKLTMPMVTIMCHKQPKESTSKVYTRTIQNVRHVLAPALVHSCYYMPNRQLYACTRT